MGMTRAKERLFLSYCLKRREFDSYHYCIRSRFIEHIPPHLIEKKDIYVPADIEVEPKGKVYQSMNNIQNFFEVDEFKLDVDTLSSGDDKLVDGCDVIHPKYGRGTLLGRSGSGDATKVSVYFPDVGKKKFLLKYANLKKA